MDAAGGDLHGALVVVRAIHFVATAVATGTLLFRAAVAEPALRSAPELDGFVRQLLRRIAWIALVVTAVSGVVWLLLQAISMSGRAPGDAMTDGLLMQVVDNTQFGRVCVIRAMLAILMAAGLARDHFAGGRRLTLTAAIGMMAAIAWTGHAASTPDGEGVVHLAADVAHLVAAAAWIGGLVPLALLLVAAQRGEIDHRADDRASAWARFARVMVENFSLLGMFSVAALLASGIVNATILVGTFDVLLVTDYGRLLTLKVALFVLMLAFATINRVALLPRIASVAPGEPHAAVLHRLTRSCVIEIALGLAIFAVVGALGTLHPAIHFAT